MSSTDVPPIRIATRASQLALWQAHYVAARLQEVAPHRTVLIEHVSTIGDRDQSGPLSALGGFGVFTREVQRAVLDHRTDIAVHSLKDLPTEPAPGLYLAAVPPRGDVADTLVLPASRAGTEMSLDALPAGSRVGTGSLRRQAQLLHVRPDLQLMEIRGNVETRLRKLDAGEYDAIVLAVAGLNRLDLGHRVCWQLTPPLMFAAVGQGALGIECRADDVELQAVLAQIDDAETHQRVAAERALLRELRGGCQAPVGVATRVGPEGLVLEAVVLSPDGRERLYATGTSVAGQVEAEELGRRVAKDLQRQGGDALISRSRKPPPAEAP